MTDPASPRFRALLNSILIGSTLMFVFSATLLIHNWVVLNRYRLEAMFFPVIVDWTFRDWRQEEDGRWSAVVHMNKRRSECVYVKDQIETALGRNKEGEIIESLVTYIGDDTPGSNRAVGWQRLDDRMKFMNPEFQPGTPLRGTVLHDCHDGVPTVSEYKNVVIGKETPWPDYVLAWREAGFEGYPEDYR